MIPMFRSAPSRRPATGWTSLLQQIRLLGVSRRWAYLITCFVGWIAIYRVLPTPNGAWSVYPSLIAGIIAGAAWPLITWNAEAPSRRGYHWSLPVARLPHDLARVAAGALYLLVGIAALAAACVGLAISDGSLAELRAVPRILWLSFFTAPLLTYLLVSPIALWNEYRITRYALIGFIVMGALAGFVGGPFVVFITAVLDPIMMHDTFGLAEVLVGTAARVGMDAAVGNAATVPDTWWSAVALWFGVALVANTAAAAWRPDDVRRLVTSFSGADRRAGGGGAA
jgi:hypothetical protein